MVCVECEDFFAKGIIAALEFFEALLAIGRNCVVRPLGAQVCGSGGRMFDPCGAEAGRFSIAIQKRI